MNIDDCPIKHLSLHSKLETYIKAGILEENDTYHTGIGNGKFLTFNGKPIQIRRQVRGTPRWKQGVPEGLFFGDAHDVAFEPETDTLIAWAIAI